MIFFIQSSTAVLLILTDVSGTNTIKCTTHPQIGGVLSLLYSCSHWKDVAWYGIQVKALKKGCTNLLFTLIRTSKTLSSPPSLWFDCHSGWTDKWGYLTALSGWSPQPCGHKEKVHSCFSGFWPNDSIQQHGMWVCLPVLCEITSLL